MTGRIDDGRVTLRSYRLTFELERRLHRIDRFRIPVPYGLPLTSLAYGAGVAMVVVLMSGLPLVGSLLALVPWPMRFILVPALGAHMLCRRRSDGRPAHEALAARLIFIVRPRRLAGLKRCSCTARVCVGDVILCADETGPVYRRGDVLGPAHAILRLPARASVRGETLEVAQVEAPPMYAPREIVLRPGQRVRFR